jgi:hypothetical protein
MELATRTQAHSPMQVIVKNVGQGNCIIVMMIQEGQEKVSDPMYDVLLVDCGTSSYQLPRGQVSATPVKHSQDIPATVTTPSHKEFTSQRIPQSTEKKLRKEKPARDTLDKLIVQTAKEIKGKKGKLNHIKAVMITHPDKDHFSLIDPIFEGIEDIKITFPLILGGSPEKYLTTSDAISKFLKDNINKVHFTAVPGGKIRNIDENYEIENSYYLLSLTGKGDSPLPSLKLNPRFEVKLLSVNANHVANLNSSSPIVTNISSTEDGIDDYNTDSLIVKIIDTATGKSIILTGDATGTTTTRLMDRVAHDGELAKELQADVLVASHHGASSHGSNNEAWIRTVSPEFIIISTGGSYGHPTRKAYHAFHTSPRLAKVTPHDVIVGGLLRSQVAHRTTFSGIFSTLPHGDIRLIFPSSMQDHVKVFSEKTHKDDKTFVYEGAWNTPQSNSDKEETEAEKAELAQVEEPLSYNLLIQKYWDKKDLTFAPFLLSLDEPENRFVQEYVELMIGQQDINHVQATLFVDNKLNGQIQFSNLYNNQKISPLRMDLKDPRNIHLVRQLVPNQVEVIHEEDILESSPPPLISSTAPENISASTLKDFIHFLLKNKVVQTQRDLALKVLPSRKSGSAQAYISRFLKSGQFSDTNDNINTELINELRENILKTYNEYYQQFIKERKMKRDETN